MRVICFHNPEEENGYLSNWFHSDFSIEADLLSMISPFLLWNNL